VLRVLDMLLSERDAQMLLQAAVVVLKLKQHPAQPVKYANFFFFCTGALAGSSGSAQAEAAAQTEMAFFLPMQVLLRAAVAVLKLMLPQILKFQTQEDLFNGQVQGHTNSGKGQENRGTYSLRPHTLVAQGLMH